MASITPMINMISLQLNKPQAARFPTRAVPSFSEKRWRAVVVSAQSTKKLAEEIKMATMGMHMPTEATKEGEKEPVKLAFEEWEPRLDGYLMYLADSYVIYQALERIIEKAAFPEYAELRNTGLERLERLGKDIEWFKQNGYSIPAASDIGINYARYLHEISEKDPKALIPHFYMTYFGHTAGGIIIGKKVEENILNGKELEFYKYEGDLPQLLRSARDKLDKLGERWTEEEKERCLHEVKNSFNMGGEIFRLVLGG